MSHTYTIRPANKDDIAALALIGRDFDAEGNVYPGELDSVLLYQDFADHIAADGFITMIAYAENGTPAAFCMWGISRVFGRFYSEALLTWFYIRPQHRSAGLARDMLDYSMQLCKDKGAKIFFASSTAGFYDGGVNERAFSALLRRTGFSVLGSILTYLEGFSNVKG